jgi:membrane associated rhomboid family serine protease
MGIQDRDYYREGSNRFLDAWGRQGPTVWLIVITCVVFFLQCVSGPPSLSPIVRSWVYNPRLIQEGEVWRLITPLFIHIGWVHLLCNMLTLYWVGIRLEDVRGGREFVAFYLLAGVFANLLYFLAYLAGIVGVASGLGASGAIAGAMVLCACYFPRQQVLLFGVIPMPIWGLALLFIGLNMAGVLGMIGGPIGYFVHLSGALFGVLYYMSGVHFTAILDRTARVSVRRARPRPALRIVPVEPEEDTPTPVGAAVESQPRPKEAVDEQLEARLDQVLAKVSKFGQESLTPEEREILVKASELYKKRRR